MIKFLVVDDEKGISEQLKDFLEDRQYKAFAAIDAHLFAHISTAKSPVT